MDKRILTGAPEKKGNGTELAHWGGERGKEVVQRKDWYRRWGFGQHPFLKGKIVGWG